MRSALVFALFLTGLSVVQCGDEGPLSFSSRTHYAKCENCVRLGETIKIMPNGEDRQDGDSFTFEIWVNVHPWPTSRTGQEGMGWAFMHAGPCSYNQCAFLGFRHDGAVIFGFILNDLKVTDHDFRADEGQWVHWSGTFNHDTRERKLYRNAELIGSDIASAGYTPHSTDLYVGQDNWSNHPFPGDISELRLWRGVVMEPDVIRKYMCAGHAHIGKPNPNAWLDTHPHASNLVIHFVFEGAPEIQIDDSQDYQERSLVYTEGSTVGGGGSNQYTLDDCKKLCDETTECLSFSFSEEAHECFLKSQCVTSDARENPIASNFKTYFKRCKDRSLRATNNPAIELHLQPGVGRTHTGSTPTQVCQSWQDEPSQPLAAVDPVVAVAESQPDESEVKILDELDSLLALPGVNVDDNNYNDNNNNNNNNKNDDGDEQPAAHVIVEEEQDHQDNNNDNDNDDNDDNKYHEREEQIEPNLVQDLNSIGYLPGGGQLLHRLEDSSSRLTVGDQDSLMARPMEPQRTAFLVMVFVVGVVGVMFVVRSRAMRRPLLPSHKRAQE